MSKYSYSIHVNKSGFTLSEVLITLAIIGVVAAITIPTLVQNYQNKAWSTAAYVFERKLTEALKTMNTQQTLAGYSRTFDFVNELSNHFKMNKICKNNDPSCFNDKVYWGATAEEVDMTQIRKAEQLGQEAWGTETIGVQFANGVTGLIAYNPGCTQDPYSNQVTGTNCLAILYDTDGFKRPNTQLKDLRSINVKSLNGNDCALELDGFCITAPFFPDPLTLEECEAVKDDLGIKYCSYLYNDYWAGAVKACGGVDNMLTQEHLRKIADFIYNTKTDNYDYNLKMDYDKVAKLGITLQSTGWGDCFSLWSNEEYEMEVPGRSYCQDRTDYMVTARSNLHGGGSYQAFCLSKSN